MNTAVIVQATVGILTVLVGMANYVSGRGGARERVREDLELLALLPDDHRLRPVLLSRAEDALDQLLRDESEKTRDTSGIVLALFLLAGAGATGATEVANNALWLLLAVPLAVFGTVGLSQDAVPRRRDERGRAIKEPQGEARQSDEK